MPKRKISKDLEQKVLQIAEKLFLEKGYSKTGIRDIAKECGISVGLIYKMFNGKDDIFIRILRKYLETSLNEIEKNLLKSVSFEDKLCTFIENFILQFKKKEKFFSLFLTSLGSNFILDRERFQFQDISKKFSEILESILEAGKKEGKLPRDIDTYFYSKYILGGIINTIYGLVVEKKQELNNYFINNVKEAIKKLLNI